MTTETTTPVAAPAAAKPAKAPKAKKPAKKAAKGKKPTKKAERKPREKKEGLNKPQIRVLQCLAKAGKPLTRAQISEKAPVDLAFCTTYIGSSDEAKRLANEAKRGTTSLLTYKYVRVEQHEGQPDTYVITSAGRSALEKAKAAAKE